MGGGMGKSLAFGGKVLDAQRGAHDDELKRGDPAALLRHLLAQGDHPREQACTSTLSSVCPVRIAGPMAIKCRPMVPN